MVTAIATRARATHPPPTAAPRHPTRSTPAPIPVAPRGAIDDDRAVGKPARRAARKDRLPRWSTSFLGRRAELGAIDERFSDGARIVTLLGPGGVGKTRLGAEHARAELDAGRGVRF